MKKILLCAVLFAAAFTASAQTPTTVTAVTNCNLYTNFTASNDGFSSPSIYSNADDVSFNWQSISGCQLETSGLTVRTASLISPVYIQSVQGSAIVGFRFSAPAGGEYRVRIVSSVSSNPLEVLATTANGPVYSSLPGVAGTICLLLTDEDLILGRQVRFEFTFRLNQPGNIMFDDLSVAVAGGPLPVTFEGFVARKNTDESLKLLWNVGKEVNVSGYFLESSTNGLQFTTAGYVAASGKSIYSLDQPGILKQNMYFRVRNLDFNGASKYTPVIKVYATEQPGAQLQIYPVPATDLVTIQHNVSAEKAIITLTGPNGYIFQQVPVVINSYQTQLNVSRLPTGIYFVTYNNGQKKPQSVKMIKY